MTYRLAIEVGQERLQAALVEEGRVSWVRLGDGNGLMPRSTTAMTV